MWVIFIVSATIIAIIMMGLLWFGNKIYLSIKRDNEKFNSESRIAFEDKNIYTKGEENNEN